MTIIFPRSRSEDGDPLACSAIPTDSCEDVEGRSPDLILLRPTIMPSKLMALQIARHERFEYGEAFALTVLPSRDFSDEAIEGVIAQYVNTKGQRRFKGGDTGGYWFEEGSSGVELLRLAPDQVWRWIDFGDVWQTTGSLDEAANCEQSIYGTNPH